MMMEALKNAALDLLPRSVFLFDRELKILYVNDNFRQMFDCSEDPVSIGQAMSCPEVRQGQCGQAEACKKCKLCAFFRNAVGTEDGICHSQIKKKLSLKGKRVWTNLVLTARSLREGVFLCMVDDITEVSRKLAEQRRQQKKLIKDLEKAKDIQSSFLPEKNQVSEFCDFTYYYRQEFKVGGDFFDVYPIDDHTFGLYIADVSGAGMSGGMLTVFLKDHYDRTLHSPAAALTKLCDKFNEHKIAEESYITMFSLVADVSAHKLRYCNAGHNQPMFLKRHHEVIDFFTAGKPVCNWYDAETKYKDSSVSYEPGDILALFTDGIADMKGKRGQVYGEDGIRALLHQSESIQGIMDKVRKSLNAFKGGEDGEDDLTLLLVELRK